MRNLVLVIILASLSGCGVPSFLITPVKNTSTLEEIDAQPGKGFRQSKIAMIPVEGMLMNANGGGFLQPAENPLSLFTQQLNEAEKDDGVKAVVLRVNSPGGTVTTSDTMYQEILRFKAKTHKPVIASCQEICASGAYYVSCGADKIMAQPTSVVGSIGVIFNTFEFEGTMAKIGMQAEAIKSGPLKDMGSPFKHLTDEERKVMQGMVDEYYGRFLMVLKNNRTVEPSKQTIATDGRVFSGEKAKEIGLIDDIGMLEDALAMARKMSDSPNAKVIMYKRPYGYRGSIYADSSVPIPQSSASNITKLEMPGGPLLPSGFYYLWHP